MKEAYVSYETAKLLKEKGFDWECYGHYNLVEQSFDECSVTIISHTNKNSTLGPFWISAPTQQMACRWLREEHKIHITTEPLEMFKQERIVYEPIIYLLNDFDDFALEYKTVHLKECDTNEDAVEAALQYCLNNLI